MTPAAVRADLRHRRRSRYLRAKLGGYFWLPCPRCGENYGGFELSHLTIPTDDRLSLGCCLACEAEVGAREAEHCETYGHQLTEVWYGAGHKTRRDGNRVEQTVTFDLFSQPPDEIYCETCFEQMPVLPGL